MERRELINQFMMKSINRMIPTGLKKIYAVGSFATGEETILQSEDFDSDKIYVSDIDIIVDVNVFALVRCYLTNVAQEISKMLTASLKSRGFATHVSISITSLRLSKFVKPIRPNTVHMFELTPIEQEDDKCVTYSIDSSVKPGKVDSINLVFSAIADYLFVRFELYGNPKVYEKCYVIAKRCLTVLYSLLIFNGYYSRSYARRITIAEKHFKKFNHILSPMDLKILQILTEYKLSGKPSILKKLPIKEKTMDQALSFLKNYFKELCLKVLIYELNMYVHNDEVYRLKKSHLTTLLREYKSRTSISFIESFVYSFLQVGRFFIERNTNKFRAVLYSLLVRRLPIGNLLDLLIGLTFANMVCQGELASKSVVCDIKLLWDAFMI